MNEGMAEVLGWLLPVVFAVVTVIALFAKHRESQRHFGAAPSEGACVACSSNDVERLTAGDAVGYRCRECGYLGGEAAAALAEAAAREHLSALSPLRRWEHLLDLATRWRRAAERAEAAAERVAELSYAALAQESQRQQLADAQRALRAGAAEARAAQAQLAEDGALLQPGALPHMPRVQAHHTDAERAPAVTLQARDAEAALVDAAYNALGAEPFARTTGLLGTLDEAHQRRFVQRWLTDDRPRDLDLYLHAERFGHQRVLTEGLAPASPAPIRRRLAAIALAHHQAARVERGAAVLLELDPDDAQDAIRARHARAGTEGDLAVQAVLAPIVEAHDAQRARAAGAISVVTDDAAGGLSVAPQAGGLTRVPPAGRQSDTS